LHEELDPRNATDKSTINVIKKHVLVQAIADALTSS
jgi:hypothetical protein